MPVKTSDDFYDVLEKSRLLPDQQIRELRDEFSGDDDPKVVASKMVKFGILNKWQALHLLAGRYALTLGRYKFLDQIDSDRTERVYLAQDPESGKRVAIKTLSRAYVEKQPKALKRFLAKAKKVASLDHPNIAHILGIDNEDDRYFLVMEHVQGKSLEEAMQSGVGSPIESAAGYLRQIAEAIGVAHQHGVMHGRLSPRSVLIDHHDRVKILNLAASGKAKTSKDDPFAAPELGNKDVSAKAVDVYSLGRLAFLLLTGQTPGDDAEDRFAELRPEAPAGLIALCSRMMSADVGRRPASMEEIAEKMIEWMGDTDQADDSESEDSAEDTSDSSGDFEVIDESEIAEVEELSVSEEDDQVIEVEEVPEVGVVEPEEDELKLAPAVEIKIDVEKPSPSRPKTPAASAPAPKAAKPPTAKPPGKKSTGKKSAADAAAPVIAPVAKQKPDSGKSESDSGQFPVEVGKKRKRKAPAVAAPAAGGGKPGIPPKVFMIGGAAVGGLVLLGGLILGATFFLRGGDEAEVASVDSESAESTPATDSAGEVDPGNPEVDPSDAEVDPVLPGEVDPVQNAEVDPVVASPSAGETSDEMATPSGDGGAEAEGTDLTAEQPSDRDAVEETVESPSDQSASGETTEPEDGSSGETAAGPDVKLEEEGVAESKPEDDPKAANPPPKSKRTPKPKVVNKKPFQELPGRLTLPELESENSLDSKKLGSVHIPDGELCFVKLRGGENACKGAVSFVVRNADGGLAEKDWDVSLVEGDSGPSTIIAHLGVNDQSELSFQWQPAAKEQPLAAHLQNCALSLSCSGENHVALFREPMKADPMPVDLQKPSTREDWELTLPPDEDAIRFEILPVTGTQATVEQKPEETLADNGGGIVRLNQAGGILSFKVSSKMGRRFEVTITPQVKFSDAEPAFVPNTRKLQSDREQLQIWVTQYEPMITRQEEAIRKKKNQDEKRRDEQKLFPYKNEVKIRKERIEKIVQLEKLLSELQEKLRFNFRVYYDAGLTDVELLKIGT